jgi:hypothetical protein
MMMRHDLERHLELRTRLLTGRVGIAVFTADLVECLFRTTAVAGSGKRYERHKVMTYVDAY